MNPLDIIQSVYHILFNYGTQHSNFFSRFGEASVAQISQKARRKKLFFIPDYETTGKISSRFIFVLFNTIFYLLSLDF